VLFGWVRQGGWFDKTLPVFDRLPVKTACNVLRVFLTIPYMDNPKDDSLEHIDCDVLAEHSGARVVIRRVIRKFYDALDFQKQASFEAKMKRWCDGDKMTPEMFKHNEGRSSRHNVMLQAFKAFKVRLYGFSFSVGDKRTFIIVDADPAKKQNKADPNILKRAKSRIDDLLDEKGTKGN
jgi:hypothetical protein